MTCHIWNFFITWQLIDIYDAAEARWFIVGSNRGTPKLLRLPSATTWWTRDQPESSSADLVIEGLAGKPRGDCMNKMVIRKRLQTKIDRKLQQQMKICYGKLKCIIMTMAHAGVCAVRRGINVKTKNGLHTQGLEVMKSVNRVCIAWGLGKDWLLNSERKEDILASLLWCLPNLLKNNFMMQQNIR